MRQSMIGKTLLALLVTAALTLSGVRPALAQEVCTADEQSTEQVLAGLTLTWDSSFTCANAPTSGEYTVTVTIQNDGASTETAVIDSLELTPITPLPGGTAPSATADVSGLPVNLAPGAGGSFVVSGSYEMAETDEGFKVSLHMLAGGSAAEPFQLGINVHVLEGEADDPDNGDDDPDNGEDDPDDGEDPSTGYYCQQSETQHPFGALLAERYGSDYEMLQAWFCDGFGWGQIMLALQTGQITGDDPSALLEERDSGAGWGDIWQRLGLIGNSNEGGGPPNDQNGDGRPDFAGPPNDEGGRPDFAGPPDGRGGDDDDDQDEDEDEEDDDEDDNGNGGPPGNPGPPSNPGGGRP
jgi:hypothetical protein